MMEQAGGIGGVFNRARDPVALARSYAERLGIAARTLGENEGIWWPADGPTVFSPFPVDTD
jgi:glyoxylase I family protein